MGAQNRCLSRGLLICLQNLGALRQDPHLFLAAAVFTYVQLPMEVCAHLPPSYPETPTFPPPSYPETLYTQDTICEVWRVKKTRVISTEDRI